MTVVAPPPHDESELLIREARARQRRRRLFAALVSALAAAAVVVASAVLFRGSRVEPAGGPTPVASLLRCHSADLRLVGRFDGAGTGQVRSTFTFTNVSATRCTLRGWPSMRVVLPSGRAALAQLLRNNGADRPLLHRRVVLRPGGAASFEVLSSDRIGLSRPCPAVREVLVTPPGARVGLRVGFGLDYCGPRFLALAPVVAGRNDHHWL